MPLDVPPNHKFACMALQGPRVADEVADGLHLGPEIWVCTSPPFEVGDWWTGLLGTSTRDRYQECDLFLVSMSHAEHPAMFDGENQRLEREVHLFMRALHLLEGARFFHGAVFLGAREGEREINARRHYAQPPCPPHGKGRQAELREQDLRRGLMLAGVLSGVYREVPRFQRYGTSPQDHSRLRRGLNALNAALGERYGNARLHRCVQALEAVIRPETGRTRARFLSRGGVLAGTNGETQTLLGQAYDLRSAEEHLNEWEAVFGGGANVDDVASLRSYQLELLACGVYRRVLETPALLQAFRTDASSDAFWQQANPTPATAWGAPIDVREAELRRTGRLPNYG